jgi:hypothetical protein
MIRTEFSGLGHYGVCTILPHQDFDRLVRLVGRMLAEIRRGEWENADVGPSSIGTTGIERCFRLLPTPNDTEICLGWVPNKLEWALHSLGLLMEAASYEARDKKQFPAHNPELTLEVCPTRSTNGWLVRANLSDQVWEVIEGPVFPALLPRINSFIQKWQEDQTGQQSFSEYTTLFGGRDGPTLQIYQPVSNGLWIVGCRTRDQVCSGWQFTDHNTDTARQAFAHIISLCAVLHYCREESVEKKR